VSPATTTARPWLNLANLLVVTTAGTLSLIWCLYFTDYLPQILTLLGMGGVFSWLALMLNVLTEGRRKHIQAKLEDILLDHHWTWIGAMLSLAVGCFWAVEHGTLILSAAGDESDRQVSLIPEREVGTGSSSIQQEILNGRGRRKFLLAVPRFGEARYRLKIDGLPAKWVQVCALRRRVVASPDSFYRRPVVLVRPSAGLSATLENPREQWRLAIKHQGTDLAQVESYRGEPLWIGCDEDVELPELLLNRWRLELASSSTKEQAMVRWMAPRSPLPELELRAKDSIRVVLYSGTEPQPVAEAEAVVRPVSRIQDFPQEVRIDVRH